jgi:hypothetical protein
MKNPRVAAGKLHMFGFQGCNNELILTTFTHSLAPADVWKQPRWNARAGTHCWGIKRTSRKENFSSRVVIATMMGPSNAPE